MANVGTFDVYCQLSFRKYTTETHWRDNCLSNDDLVLFFKVSKYYFFLDPLLFYFYLFFSHINTLWLLTFSPPFPPSSSLPQIQASSVCHPLTSSFSFLTCLSPSSGWSNQTGSNGSSSCGQLVLIFSRVQSLQNLRRKEATFPSTVHGHSWGQAGWRLLLCLKVCCASETKKAKDSIFPPQEAYCLINKD